MTRDEGGERALPADRRRLVAAATEHVLEVVRGVVDELHPRRSRHLHVYLDSHLERDLGLDSLSRAELLLRLGQVLNLDLPEMLLATAETPRDFVQAAVEALAGTAQMAWAGDPRDLFGPAPPFPAGIETLTEALEWRAETTPERPHVLLESGAGATHVITYGTLHGRALAIARALGAHGVEPDDRVAIMLPTDEDFFCVFFGVLYAGAIPVPLYPARRISNVEDHLQRQRGIIGNAGAKLLVMDAAHRNTAGWLAAGTPDAPAVVTPDDLIGGPGSSPAAAPRAGSIALIQYTSGSTGAPKGVVLTHANLLANIRAMAQAIRVGPADVFVSWLPLYHDLGLIAAWLGCLCFGTPTVIMTPQTFIARPESWLWAIHRHRATLSGGPNFAFDYCVHRIRPARLEGLDLGSLRVLFNGAEPISADTLARFHERFEPFGLRREVIRPVYGLAENSVGLAVPPPGRPPLIDRIDAQMLHHGGRAEPVADAGVRALEVVGCGQPLPGHEIRIVGSNGRELPDRHEGRVQFRGPSASPGYFRNPEETELLFDGDWLNSGDLGYLAEGELFITGRDKDLIIRGGRNIHPVAIEKRVEELPGVRRGAVAVFGAPDPRLGTERLVVVAETRLYKTPEREKLSRNISETVTRLLDLPPDDVVLVPPYTVPKTSSGKLRRQNTRQLYLSGAMARGRLAMWGQQWRIGGEAALQWLRRRRRDLCNMAYAAYAWTLLCLLTPPTWALVVLLPGRWMRLAALRQAARLLTRLSGTPLRIEVAAPLPEGAAVLVANHASYLDCLPLVAALPALPSFVAKRELAGNWLTGPFLRGIGTLFITRRHGDGDSGIDEMHRVTERLAAGERVLFFPEGTFTRQPGLLPFQLGAFVAAASTGCPVVPVTLTGTRAMLRLGRWRPSRGRLAVYVGEAIRPDGTDWAVAVRLRDAARDAVLARCGEPDLADTVVIPGRPESP